MRCASEQGSRRTCAWPSLGLVAGTRRMTGRRDLKFIVYGHMLQKLRLDGTYDLAWEFEATGDRCLEITQLWMNAKQGRCVDAPSPDYRARLILS